jgi:hypothetical protein
MARRVAIVGTADSWSQAPFGDPSAEIWSLNDAYRLPGFVRADRWYDFHPLDKYHYVEEVDGKAPVVYAHQIPADKYLRPATHLDWLAKQPFPKFLHPDFAAQHPDAATWPNVHPFPRKEIEAHFGRYFTSSPGWMLAHAVMEGVRDIEIYGIHLATEHEYIDQRPNFEFLIGCVLGAGPRTMTEQGGLRVYQSADGRIVLPERSPVLSAGFQYAFEPSPRKQLEPLRWELHKAQVKLTRRMEALKTITPFWPCVTVQEPDDANPGQVVPVRKTISTVQQEIWHYEALVGDCRDALSRVEA